MRTTILLATAVLACGPIAAQAPQQAPQRPRLPAAIAGQIERDEKDLDEKFDKDKLKTDWLPAAIRTAQHAFEVHKDNQGPDWWETWEAWWRLQRLQRLAGFKPADRELLKLLVQLEVDVKRLMREKRYEQALAILRQARPVTAHLFDYRGPEYAELLLAMAEACEIMGRHQLSEELCMQAAEIDFALSPHLYARDLRVLAQIYFGMHHYSIGREIAFRALNLDLYQLGEDSNEYAVDLLNLAIADDDQGVRDLAVKGLTRSAEIFRKLPSRDGASSAVCLTILGALYTTEGQYEQARRVLEEALEIRSNASLARASEEDQIWAGNFENTLKQMLGVVDAYEGHFDKAVPMLVSALRGRWTEFAVSFPFMTADQKGQLLATGRGSPAATLDIILSLACDGKLRDNRDALNAILLTKHLKFEADRQEDGALLAALPKLPQQARSDLKSLREAQVEFSAADDETMMAPRILASSGTSSGQRPDDAGKRRELWLKIKALDLRLRREIPAYATNAQVMPPTADEVMLALRSGEALIEFVPYDALSVSQHDLEKPQDRGDKSGSNRGFAALVVIGGSKQIAAVRIPDSRIGDAVTSLQKKMADYAARVRQMKVDNREPDRSTLADDESDMAALLAKLRQQVWSPLEPHLMKGNVRRVYIAPDGYLGLIPFEALATRVNNSWKYLVEDFDICYLNSGRDLARLASVRSPQRNGPPTAVLVGNPLFNARPIQLARAQAAGGGVIEAGAKPGMQTAGDGVAGVPSRSPRIERDLKQERQFSDLIAAARAALKGWQIQHVWTDGQATEENVLSVEAPTLLQFATHGSFLEAEPPTSICGGSAEDPLTLACEDVPATSPLTRSMLFLAGVNRWRPEQSQFYWDGKAAISLDEAADRGIPQSRIAARTVHVGDGILTAYKVTGMNLLGTELVNLTACETAVGDITPDGIAGLRQSFFLAGARAVTMNLWQVPLDEVVKTQMGEFYNLWPQRTTTQPAVSRFAAFHRAQLTALSQTRKNYGCGIPFYWAATIYVGDPGDLPDVLGKTRD